MIYIHVPFCLSRCIYCDFFSTVPENNGPMERYTDALCGEIRRRAAEMDGQPPTLYFGGGTPSVLPLECLTRILLTLEEVGHGGPYKEFTLEANPDDVVQKGLPYLESLRQLGVNRMSLGVQSFDDELLRWMRRRHDAQKAREAVRLVREAGFRNLSLDLIFGLSNLSEETWERTIDEVLALKPEHISCYQLTVEGESPLTGMLEDGRYEEAPEELCRAQYDLLCRKLGAAGYNHYEISNFALPGFEAVHNGGYWARRPYVGLGPSAHSFSGCSRSWNENKLDAYKRTEESLSEEDEKVETLMLGLRTAAGVDAAFLEENAMRGSIETLVEAGALVKIGPRYRIPEDHFFTSDEIIRQLI